MPRLHTLEIHLPFFIRQQYFRNNISAPIFRPDCFGGEISRDCVMLFSGGVPREVRSRGSTERMRGADPSRS